MVADEFLDRGGIAGDRNGFGLDARDTQQTTHITTLIREHQSDHIALVSGSCGSARTMEEGLRVCRWVDLHHKLDTADVDAACGHVGRDEDTHITFAECTEVPVALVLRKIAVQLRCGNTVIGQILGEFLRLMLGSGEEYALT
jgi:hypothetical protein